MNDGCVGRHGDQVRGKGRFEMTISKDVVIHVPFTLPLIHCQNPECEMEFVMISIIRGEGNYESFQQEWPQAKVDYCPYCGMKQTEVK